jgi:uncharacterized protein RhaS with RHS repeats
MDPIGEQGGQNLYGMVGNNAVRETDFLGLLAGFVDCCANEEKALITHEQTALNQMKTLLEELDAAIASPELLT